MLGRQREGEGEREKEHAQAGEKDSERGREKERMHAGERERESALAPPFMCFFPPPGPALCKLGLARRAVCST